MLAMTSNNPYAATNTSIRPRPRSPTKFKRSSSSELSSDSTSFLPLSTTSSSSISDAVEFNSKYSAVCSAGQALYLAGDKARYAQRRELLSLRAKLIPVQKNLKQNYGAFELDDYQQAVKGIFEGDTRDFSSVYKLQATLCHALHGHEIQVKQLHIMKTYKKQVTKELLQSELDEMKQQLERYKSETTDKIQTLQSDLQTLQDESTATIQRQEEEISALREERKKQLEVKRKLKDAKKKLKKQIKEHKEWQERFQREQENPTVFSEDPILWLDASHRSRAESSCDGSIDSIGLFPPGAPDLDDEELLATPKILAKSKIWNDLKQAEENDADALWELHKSSSLMFNGAGPLSRRSVQLQPPDLKGGMTKQRRATINFSSSIGNASKSVLAMMESTSVNYDGSSEKQQQQQQEQQQSDSSPASNAAAVDAANNPTRKSFMGGIFGNVWDASSTSPGQENSPETPPTSVKYAPKSVFEFLTDDSQLSPTSAALKQLTEEVFSF